jgi:hypothetical protein
MGVILICLGNQTSVAKAALVNDLVIQYKDKLQSAFTVIQPKTIRIRK